MSCIRLLFLHRLPSSIDNIAKQYHLPPLVFDLITEKSNFHSFSSFSYLPCQYFFSFLFFAILTSHFESFFFAIYDLHTQTARDTEEWHREKFGYVKSNVKFISSHIEEIPILPDASFDIIVSNCVVNLSPDKRAVLSEAYRLLKPGGEMYFSDVYSNQRVPSVLKKDPVLWGECLSGNSCLPCNPLLFFLHSLQPSWLLYIFTPILACFLPSFSPNFLHTISKFSFSTVDALSITLSNLGALYWNDFLRLAKECGFKDPRLVKDAPITIENAPMKTLLGPIEFFSATYR